MVFGVSEPAKMDREGRATTVASPDHHLAFLNHTLSEGALKHTHFRDEKTEGWDHSEVWGGKGVHTSYTGSPGFYLYADQLLFCCCNQTSQRVYLEKSAFGLP